MDVVAATPAPSDGDGRPINARQTLGLRLRALRESRRLTLEEAASHIEASASKLSRMELGRVGIKELDLHDLLTLYGISDAGERLAFIERNQRLSEPRWWSTYGSGFSEWYCSYLVLESAAQHIRTYEVRFIPGLLQTRSYAEAVIRPATTDEDQVGRLVDVRLHRQRLVLERGVPRLWAIVEYSALTEGFTDPRIMQEQIRFLLDITESSDVTIQIIMPGAGGLTFRGNSFSILQHESSEVVYMEHLDRAQFLDDRNESEIYRRTMGELVILADEPRRSRRTLEEILRRES
ncbi:hypothetical protein MB27_24700 [Actinoplanes utahensis]|uniref:HTH cro/C1-type domain-containing protein n=2 Tax=Actinoplanes utahensis TaxID=1869 RepID=A0A0A6ULC6_ACTUT|nr:hypothetical protein MB27_24700 [Actinoplanes utahensis]